MINPIKIPRWVWRWRYCPKIRANRVWGEPSGQVSRFSSVSVPWYFLIFSWIASKYSSSVSRLKALLDGTLRSLSPGVWKNGFLVAEGVYIPAVQRVERVINVFPKRHFAVALFPKLVRNTGDDVANLPKRTVGQPVNDALIRSFLQRFSLLSRLIITIFLSKDKLSFRKKCVLIKRMFDL